MLGLAVVTVVGGPLAVAFSGGGTGRRPGTGGAERHSRRLIGMALFTLAFFVTTERVSAAPHPLPFRAARAVHRQSPSLLPPRARVLFCLDR